PIFPVSVHQDCGIGGGQGARCYQSHPFPPVARLRGSHHRDACDSFRARSPERPSAQSSTVMPQREKDEPGLIFVDWRIWISRGPAPPKIPEKISEETRV